VRIRVVVEQAVLAEPGAVAEAVDSLRRGLEGRVVDRLPIKLVLADADLAVEPGGESGDESGVEPGAVLLHRSGLLAGRASAATSPRTPWPRLRPPWTARSSASCWQA